MNNLVRITTLYFCAGLEIDEQKLIVVRTPPILKYMINWPWKKVYSYCEKKKWKLDLFDESDNSKEVNTMFEYIFPKE